ncbi:hypothetical protein [Sphingopyxis sp. KK2]|uniref:hypothetical protein n=1 Tax=Sphingopyxis sp. KK2 TaxID=1855727 RepID=UPI00097E5DF8|nr:hypothetical protein [Sphingopyxis sp. KK2]
MNRDWGMNDMGTSIIDGTVTATDVKRTAGDMTIFKTIDFLRDDGTSQSLNNAVTRKDVTEMLQPGTRGRFYGFSALDIGGIHGVRTADGRAAFAYPGGNNQKIFLMAAIVGGAFVAFMVATRGEIPLFGAAALILGVVGYIFMGKGARETRAQFDGDSGYVPTPAGAD